MTRPNVNDYESAMLVLLENWTSRTTGENLFVGELSRDQLEVTAIIIGSEIVGEDTDKLRKYNARYIGKFKEREDCITEMDKVRQQLIKYSEDITIEGGTVVKLHQVRQRGGEALFETKQDGLECWNFTLNLIIEFK